MKRLVIPAILAAAVATAAPSPAPAADTRDIAAVFAGLVALGLIAKAIDDAKDDDRASAAAPAAKTPAAPIWGRSNGYDNRNRKTGFAKLPPQCRYRVQTESGSRFAYDRQCLSRSYRHVAHLPPQCERRIRTGSGLARVYSEPCLADRGFPVEARRRY